MSDTTIRENLTVSASPHKRTADTTRGIMLDVILALVPALVLSVVLFGPRALLVTVVSAAACVLFEFLARKVMRRSTTVGDLSAVVTGILLAFNLPSTIPLWMVVIGDAVAIIVAKQFFGGIGQNFVNPAIAGRIVLMASFPVQMSDYPAAFAWRAPEVAAVTSATPLAQFSDLYSAENLQSAMASADLPPLLNMLFGVRGGCLGETCAAALLIGFVYLLIRRVISPTVPLVFVGTVAVIMLIAGKGDFTFVAYQLLSGGLLLGAIFMATDYTTSPVNFKGKLIFAVGCGVVTSLIRIFASLPEGVSFAILLMNILVPHIDRLTTPKPFGTRKEKKQKKEAAA
ncbi:MAG TPA: RnfABCDGE type electron transport complex subunit D [Candidatus Fimenecus excrementigallinarum]|uniref:Ion-translocating oxidoreductase complex subunit D n=1 Tax=Candidatus Fimenecus excrementigallinarum TaxID=2840816 RepID=A0A9D1IEA7_9FIRM|nr:RnfABCDGE type electron transport complex subunit D [Candidatus Fimenecus excrementigallinarum]